MNDMPKFIGFRGDGQSQRRFWETVKYLVSIGAIQISEGPKRGVSPLKDILERSKMDNNEKVFIRARSNGKTSLAINSMELLLKIEQLRVLYTEAVSKSEELMPGDFKQYFDEDFTDKMAEILWGEEYDN